MRAVIQRVSKASVLVEGEVTGSIQSGLLILLGVEVGDTVEDLNWLAGKITRLRIFNDEEGQMNRSLLEVEGSILLVSQFTLHASTKKGNRPSYIRAARPEEAIPLYKQMKEELSKLMGKSVETGVFGAHMEVTLVNDGPVTIQIDTKNKE